MRLFLNLGTDTTFLFRDAEVSEVARVLPEALQESLARARGDQTGATSAGCRATRDLRYMRGHFSRAGATGPAVRGEPAEVDDPLAR